MPTASGHTRAILASKVTGTDVYGIDGEKMGHIADIALDKTSNNILFVIIGFGGIFGLNEKYHPIPWSLLHYNEATGYYVVPMTKDLIKAVPIHDLETLTRNDGDAIKQAYAYY